MHIQSEVASLDVRFFHFHKRNVCGVCARTLVNAHTPTSRPRGRPCPPTCTLTHTHARTHIKGTSYKNDGRVCMCSMCVLFPHVRMRMCVPTPSHMSMHVVQGVGSAHGVAYTARAAGSSLSFINTRLNSANINSDTKARISHTVRTANDSGVSARLRAKHTLHGMLHQKVHYAAQSRLM